MEHHHQRLTHDSYTSSSSSSAPYHESASNEQTFQYMPHNHSSIDEEGLEWWRNAYRADPEYTKKLYEDATRLYNVESKPVVDSEEYPVLYVNKRQYARILKRREQRMKLEARMKLSRKSKPFLHESRHAHAVNRIRGSGGRFLSKAEKQKLLEQQNSELNHTNITENNEQNDDYIAESSTTLNKI